MSNVSCWVWICMGCCLISTRLGGVARSWIDFANYPLPTHYICIAIMGPSGDTELMFLMPTYMHRCESERWHYAKEAVDLCTHLIHSPNGRCSRTSRFFFWPILTEPFLFVPGCLVLKPKEQGCEVKLSDAGGCHPANPSLSKMMQLQKAGSGGSLGTSGGQTPRLNFKLTSAKVFDLELPL